jgi:hypothetical protein
MRLNTKQLVNEYAKDFNLSYNDLLGNNIDYYNRYIRKCIAHRLMNKHGYTPVEVAETFKISKGTVYQFIEYFRKEKLKVEFNAKNI